LGGQDVDGEAEFWSFTDVLNDLYARATLGVYERNHVAALRDVFLWAYERSAARYAAARQYLGEPDPFRLRYRDRLRTTILDIVRAPMNRQAARAHLINVAQKEVQPADQKQFIEITETELLGLHEGNFARYQVRPSDSWLGQRNGIRPDRHLARRLRAPPCAALGDAILLVQSQLPT